MGLKVYVAASSSELDRAHEARLKETDQQGKERLAGQQQAGKERLTEMANEVARESLEAKKATE